MFIKLSDADLDATSAKAEIKYEIYIVSSCINAVCVCVCVCVHERARVCVCVCSCSSVGPHWLFCITAVGKTDV